MSHRLFSLILCICVNFAALSCVLARVHESNNGNVNYTLPAYAIASRADLLNSTTCGKELRNFRDAVDRRILWGLRVLDSSGGYETGFLYGNNYWLGRRSQCSEIMNTIPAQISKRGTLNNTMYRDPQKELPPFKLNFFAAHLRHNSTLQYRTNAPHENLMTLGLCLPTSCSVNELSFILEEIFRDRALVINNLYSVDFRLIEVKDLKDDYQWLLSGAMPVICSVLALNISMMIIGTIYDIFVHQKYFNPKNKTNVKTLTEEGEIMVSSSHQESRIGKVLICFSVYTNTKIILKTKLNADAIPIIHGLKFLSMTWIIMAHTVLYTFDYMDNILWIWRLTEALPTQILQNATLSTDTYFFLSGFLVSYLYLRNKTHKERAKPINYREKLNEFFFSVMKRFIRLTPAYMIMIGILQLVSTWYDKTSEFYMDEKPHEACAKYWWQNLLYINNMLNRKEMCMSWSWYLANDMQFFVIGMALLILSTIYFYTAIIILGALLIGSIVLSGYISYIYEYIPTLDEQYRLLNVLYYPPWVRIGPHIIGLFTGCIVARINKKIVLKRRTVILYWCLGSICNIFVLFGLYNRNISVLSSAMYVALGRTVWAIGIAWIVIACFIKHGGIVNQLLSFRGWIPFSRLTYCAYLVNPLIMHSTRLHSETSVHLEIPTFIITFVGYVGISYFCAYILSLMSETPYILLLRMYDRSRYKREPRKNEIIISKM